jgi:hypothetical protein
MGCAPARLPDFKATLLEIHLGAEARRRPAMQAGSRPYQLRQWSGQLAHGDLRAINQEAMMRRGHGRVLLNDRAQINHGGKEG